MAFRLTVFKNFVKPATPSLYFVQARGVGHGAFDISGRGKDAAQTPAQETGTVAAKAEQNKSENEANENMNTIIGKGATKGTPKDKGKVPQYGQGQNKGSKV